MSQGKNIFISNLPNQVTEFSLLKLLSQFGKITNFNFPVHKDRKQSGQTLGYCFVAYENQSDAVAAIKNKPKLIDDVMEFKFEYDEKVISSELEKEEGIIDKDKLSEILEKSKKVHTEKRIITDKSRNKIDIDKTKNPINPVKIFNEKRNQIKRIEEALKKYQ